MDGRPAVGRLWSVRGAPLADLVQRHCAPLRYLLGLFRARLPAQESRLSSHHLSTLQHFQKILAPISHLETILPDIIRATSPRVANEHVAVVVGFDRQRSVASMLKSIRYPSESSSSVHCIRQYGSGLYDRMKRRDHPLTRLTFISTMLE